MRDYPTLHLETNQSRNRACVAVLHFSHSRVFNNENNSYPKIGVKRPPVLSGTLYSSVNKHYICDIFVILMSFCV